MKGSKLSAIMMMAMAMSDSYPTMDAVGDDNPKSLTQRPKKNTQPKGTKTYFFNSDGEFSTERMLKTETVFICYAINDKNAIRKFNKWKTKSK